MPVSARRSIARTRSTSSTAFVGYAIELIFEDGEEFAGTGGGDLESVTVDAHGSSVLIKPHAEVVATNLVVFTDRRAYRFDYTALTRAPRATDEVMYAVRFLYPPPPRTATGEDPQAVVERELAAAPVTRPRNSNYWYCGHWALRPTAVVDDGVQTRITFGDRVGDPGDLRAQRGWVGVAAELLDGGRRGRDSSTGAAVHLAARPADRLHREQGFFRRGTAA